VHRLFIILLIFSFGLNCFFAFRRTHTEVQKKERIKEVVQRGVEEFKASNLWEERP